MHGSSTSNHKQITPSVPGETSPIHHLTVHRLQLLSLRQEPVERHRAFLMCQTGLRSRPCTCTPPKLFPISAPPHSDPRYPKLPHVPVHTLFTTALHIELCRHWWSPAWKAIVPGRLHSGIVKVCRCWEFSLAAVAELILARNVGVCCSRRPQRAVWASFAKRPRNP